MAIWARGRQGVHDLTGLIHHTDAGSQPIHVYRGHRTPRRRQGRPQRRHGRRCLRQRAGQVKSEIGLFKTEVIRPQGPWKGLDQVELAVLEWVDWHNHRRLHTACYDPRLSRFARTRVRASRVVGTQQRTRGSEGSRPARDIARVRGQPRADRCPPIRRETALGRGLRAIGCDAGPVALRGNIHGDMRRQRWPTAHCPVSPASDGLPRSP